MVFKTTRLGPDKETNISRGKIQELSLSTPKFVSGDMRNNQNRRRRSKGGGGDNQKSRTLRCPQAPMLDGRQRQMWQVLLMGQLSRKREGTVGFSSTEIMVILKRAVLAKSE